MRAELCATARILQVSSPPTGGGKELLGLDRRRCMFASNAALKLSPHPARPIFKTSINSYYANHANAACRIIYRQNLNSVLLLTSNSQIHRPAIGKLKGIPIGTVNRE